MNTNKEDLLPYVKLQFYVSHPALEDCYLEGYESANLDKPEDSNPYPLNTAENEYWLDGWWAGFYGEAPCLEMFNEDKTVTITDLTAANDQSFDAQAEELPSKSRLTVANVAKVAAAVAVSIVGYQVLDMIA